MVDHNQPDSEDSKSSGDGMNNPLSDVPLLDLLDGLVSDQGKVAAAEALGVNYRTMVACYESRRISRRMRRALEEYRDGAVDDAVGADGDDADDMTEKVVALEQRVIALEEEHEDLREIVEAQAKHLTELERKVEGLEEEEPQETEADASEVDDRQRKEWRPPSRGHGLPDAGVVTMHEQADEKHAFGPAAPLVGEWRSLRTVAEVGSRVDRARASVRRWELEVAMIGDYGLTLPPETEPLDASRREDHLRWRQEALAEAQRELSKAQRMRWVRRALTIGMWWR